MGELKNTPDLRFKGFDDIWNEKVLGELCQIGDVDHRMPKSIDQGIPYLMTGDFIGVNELDFKNSKKISLNDYELLSRKIKPEYGDLLFARYASVGAVRYVETHMKFLVSYSCAIIKKTDSLNGKFLYSAFQSHYLRKKIEQEINTGSQGNVGIETLKQLNVVLPTKAEQVDIGFFFKNLDNQITHKQRKLDKLVTLKKAMLEKMLPREGADEPEIRFKGFSGGWEENYLGNLAKITTGNSNRQDSDIDGEYTFFDRSDDIRKSGIYLFDCEAIIVAGEGSEFFPKYFVGKFDLHQRTYAIMNFDILVGKYLYYYIFLFRRHFLNSAVGSTVKSLRLPMFKEMLVKYPSILEQEKIGHFFKNLDELISLKKTELTKLKQIKSSCLEKMFV